VELQRCNETQVNDAPPPLLQSDISKWDGNTAFQPFKARNNKRFPNNVYIKLNTGRSLSSISQAEISKWIISPPSM
jgi:hypothetical protein